MSGLSSIEKNKASIPAMMRDSRVLFETDYGYSYAPVAPSNEKLTVVVIVHRPDWLAQVCCSLSCQNYKDWRVLIVLAKSEFREAARAITAAYWHSLPPTDIFSPARESNYAFILNTALSYVKTEYICMLRCGDLLAPSALSVVGNAIQKTRADLYHSRYFTADYDSWAVGLSGGLYANRAQFVETGIHTLHPLFTYRLKTIYDIGGFLPVHIQHPTQGMAYSLAASNKDIEHIPAFLYFWRNREHTDEIFPGSAEAHIIKTTRGQHERVPSDTGSDR